jgi:hypothetical protein
MKRITVAKDQSVGSDSAKKDVSMIYRQGSDAVHQNCEYARVVKATGTFVMPSHVCRYELIDDTPDHERLGSGSPNRKRARPLVDRSPEFRQRLWCYDL